MSLTHVERRDREAPFFSICIPQFNRTRLLIEACRSLDRQRFRDFEVCISDDVSTDGLASQLFTELDRSQLAYVYLRRESNGRYDANLRSAIALARGRYVFLLGNDDALKDDATLGDLHALLAAGDTVVLFSEHEDYATGRVVTKASGTRALGSGPRIAASAFRRFSFVSGLVLDRAGALRAATSKWDGSEMYQMYLGCRLIAEGGVARETGRTTVRKDIQLAGEVVDSYARRPRVALSGIPAQPIQLTQHARLVLDAIHVGAPVPASAVVSVVTQFFGALLPYWLLEYRRVQSWKYAAGVARAMRPKATLAGTTATLGPRLLAQLLYGVMTAAGLLAPTRALDALHAPARTVARWVGHLGVEPSQS